MHSDRLREAQDDARREAYPLVILNAGVLLAVAMLSEARRWELLGGRNSWLWLAVAAPLAALGVRLLAGIGGLRGQRGRAVSLRLLAAVAVGNPLGAALLVI